jgi:predicted YcjX-like family ATPase
MSESSETPCPEKPPRSTQFKPGQSGNPLGRPRRKLDMSVTLNRALNDKIRVTNLGTTRTGMEAFVQSIVDRVLQGDSKGIPPANEPVQQGKGFQTRPQPHSPRRCRR